MKRTLLLLALISAAGADKTYVVGDGGVDLYPLPRHSPLDDRDKAALFDTGGRRSGLVRGTTLRLLDRQEYRYNRSSYEGTVITNLGAADAHRRHTYFYRVGYFKVVAAPAQPHMVGREGWVVMEKHRMDKGKWVVEGSAPLR